jgi:hypothetical protein
VPASTTATTTYNVRGSERAHVRVPPAGALRVRDARHPDGRLGPPNGLTQWTRDHLPRLRHPGRTTRATCRSDLHSLKCPARRCR